VTIGAFPESILFIRVINRSLSVRYRYEQRSVEGRINQVINNVARVFTPKDTGVITPNSAIPYSFLILDLRAEPIVVTPAIESKRYYWLQLVDLCANNVDYLGTRKDKTLEAGSSLLVRGGAVRLGF
jgi:hypothetical protein